MNNNRALIVGAIVVAALAGVYLFQNQNLGTAPQTNNETGIQPRQDQEQNVVIHTNSGFSPSTLTVSLGTTVTFINEADTPMWVASDSHPLHTDYPDFDALEGFSTGESYSYTFTEPGTYGYHDHLNPGHTGVVVVE